MQVSTRATRGQAQGRGDKSIGLVRDAAEGGMHHTCIYADAVALLSLWAAGSMMIRVGAARVHTSRATDQQQADGDAARGAAGGRRRARRRAGGSRARLSCQE